MAIYWGAHADLLLTHDEVERELAREVAAAGPFVTEERIYQLRNMISGCVRPREVVEAYIERDRREAAERAAQRAARAAGQ